ncbi:unnamed protein product [Nezara viridula]|uniref:MADF domain-containing protein n=1 Tax=Nezara viridula TaxID=85310 RepID=A0A9P0E701_NEZVI|nr:unnamed protein product [Nezara viridula]
MFPVNMNQQEVNLKLVGEVEKHPELYNFKLPEFTRKSVTDKAWQEVADEMNMPVADVKEKWRNLRSVFMRRMRSPEDGSKKKAYYLEHAMKFCLPYIKQNNTSSSLVLSSTGTTQSTNEELVENIDTCEENSFQLHFPQLSSPAPTDPSNSPATSPFQQNNVTLPQQTKDKPVKFSLPLQGNKLFIVRNKAAGNTDHQYHQPDFNRHKKAKIQINSAESTSKKLDRQQSIKMFLLSLMPELEELTDYQIKLFKRRVFCIIDEVSNSRE